MKKINVGLIGFGTIGAGVIKVLKSKRKFLREKNGVDINIASICDKDLKSKRSVKVDRKILTKLIPKVINDPKIDIIVELMGGINPAKDVVLGALRNGKDVVTANKALLSGYGLEIFNLANTLGLCVGFEASVCGGVPVIRALKEGFAANRIDIVYGIINGTSNYILSKMAEDGVDFKTALESARARGYTERDPGLDINGGDSCHKLSILALLGFGIAAKQRQIYTEGIVDVEAADIQYAKEMGYAIKLLAIAKRVGSIVELRVHPTLIPTSHLLANVKGVYNAIFIKGDLIGENLFYGQGAGANPTSSAVVSDIIAIAKCIQNDGSKREKCIPFIKDTESIKKMDEVKTRHYVRFSALDKPGVLAAISGILAKYRISIANVTQKDKGRGRVVPIVMMTHEALEKDMAKALKEIDRLSLIKKKSVRIRVEG